MHFLLTNDDGVAAPGIWAAARALAALGTVLIVAPAHNHSGYGAALPPQKEIAYAPYAPAQDLARNVTAFALHSTPAACVQVGLSGVFSRRPVDLVISGINDARNIGRDVFYSGTVGAALTAHLLGVPALAVSLDGPGRGVMHWDTAAWAVQESIKTHSTSSDAAPLLFNINIPNLPLSELAGVSMTTLGSACCVGKYAVHANSEHTIGFTPRLTLVGAGEEEGTDAWVLEHGYVSMTPLRLLPDRLLVAPWTSTAASLPFTPLVDALMAA
jgi:5'-nucleotidase